MTTVISRNSRWTRHAPRGQRTTAYLSSHDLAIFTALARYRYLPADYIHAFVGGSYKYLIHRLGQLSRHPNLFLVRPPQQRENAAANHRPLVYELDQRGVRLLQERGVSIERLRPPASFAHELMTCLVMASFELGACESGARLISWNDILASRSLPESTRRSPKPWNIPVSATIDGQRYDTHIAADGQPFGIEQIVDGRPGYFFCPGIEADCGTEPIDASDFTRSSIAKKFALYLAVETQGIHLSHFGFPNFYVPFITTNAARLASMMRLLERLTGAVGSKMFLFKTFPAFTSFEKPPAPSGHMLIGDWQRVGHQLFNFLTS